jgi:hypothetical protein
MPLPPPIPPSPAPYATFRFLPLPPAFTFLQQNPTYSPYLEQNPLAPPEHVQFTLFAGGRYEKDNDLTTHQSSVDWSGIGTLATRVNLQAPRYFITLGNAISYRHSFTSGTSGLDALNLAAAAGYSLTPRISLGVTDTLVYSNNLLQSIFPQQNLGLYVSQQYSTTNDLTVSSNIVLSPVSSLGLFVGNSIVSNKTSSGQNNFFVGPGNGTIANPTANLQDSITGRVGASFNTTLVPRIPLGVTYEYDYTSYSSSPNPTSPSNLTQHTLGANTAYNLDSVTSLIFNASANYRIQSLPGDAHYYSASLRLQREVYTGITCWVGAGGYMYDTADQGIRRRFSYLFGCGGSGGADTSAQLTRNLTLDLGFSSGVTDTSSEVVNYGLVSYTTASAALRFFPTRDFLATLRVSGTHTNLLESTSTVPNATRGNTFNTVETGLYVTYTITKWLSAYATLTGSRRFADSGDNIVIYRADAGLSTGFGF